MFSECISIRIYEEGKNEESEKAAQEVFKALFGAISLVYLLPQAREDDRGGTWWPAGSLLEAGI